MKVSRLKYQNHYNHPHPPPPGISQPLPHYSLEEPDLHHHHLATVTTTAAIDLKKRTAELQQSSKLAQV